MLVLTRKRGQEIVIDHQGKTIVVKVGHIRTSKVTLKVLAPYGTPIKRGPPRVKPRKGAA